MKGSTARDSGWKIHPKRNPNSQYSTAVGMFRIIFTLNLTAIQNDRFVLLDEQYVLIFAGKTQFNLFHRISGIFVQAMQILMA
jgi:hypothetical protein